MVNDGVSPAYSFHGWSFKKWLFGNGKTIKEIIKVGVPLTVSYMSNNVRSPTILIVYTLIGKLTLDSLEYFIKEKRHMIEVESYLPELKPKEETKFETY